MKKRIVVAPLDWGLGHATRCIPIIRTLAKEHEVLIATSGLALSLLKQEFPGLKFFELPSYNVSYQKRLPFMVAIFLRVPGLLMVIRKEHRVLAKLIEEQKVDVVISDNRYGCYSKKIKSIFITHQLTLLIPSVWRWTQPLVNWQNNRLIKRFDECWVPDDSGENRITGKLTKSNLNVNFMGMLSRFEKSKQPIEKKYDLLVLLSGPEPQRSIFEEIIVNQLSDVEGMILMVRGRPGSVHQQSGNKKVTIIDHLPAHELQQAIEESKLVLSRSGYTTVMDLWFLQKKAIFVPTPGQTEQEYLAKQLMRNKIAYSVSQKAFQLKEAIKESRSYAGFVEPSTSNFQLLTSSIEK